MLFPAVTESSGGDQRHEQTVSVGTTRSKVIGVTRFLESQMLAAVSRPPKKPTVSLNVQDPQQYKTCICQESQMIRIHLRSVTAEDRLLRIIFQILTILAECPYS